MMTKLDCEKTYLNRSLLNRHIKVAKTHDFVVDRLDYVVSDRKISNSNFEERKVFQ